MMNRMMLTSILGGDYRILEAGNGKQCLELLRAKAGQKSMGLRLFCKLFVNPIDKVGGQEYIFSSRTDRVLKQNKLLRRRCARP